MGPDEHRLVDAVRERAEALEGPDVLDRLVEQLATQRLVLLGEASHGTADFYRLRREISQRLIERHGFAGVVAEADWPDALQVTRFAHGHAEGSAEQALETFRRFPTWMWRNGEIAELARWLRAYNARTGSEAGFYGMDLYSLHASMKEVVRYLEDVDPEAARRAHARYLCFDRFGDDAQEYGRATSYRGDSCEQQAIDQLLELQRRRAEAAGDADALFYTEQNARLVKNAEGYYRSMFQGRASSWNLRDRHMTDTLDALLDHLARTGKNPRLVVWAHNSHLGDASATGMADRGELNVGQLVRERHPEDCALVGFTTYDGTVTAAHDWEDDAQRMTIRPALEGSVEELLHAVGIPAFILSMDDLSEGLSGLRDERLERFIGVIYRPATERFSHYFEARLAEQFDHLIHVDRTRALRPLAHAPLWTGAEDAPETYPFAL